MADNLPISFAIPQEGAIASYSFIELASGQGIATFYAGRLVDDDYIKSSTFYSDTVKTTSANMGISADAKRLDIDFDVTINKSMIIKGEGLVNVGIGVSRSGSNNSGYIIAKLRKYVGAVETDIITNQSRTHANNAASGYTYSYLGIDLAVPETKLNPGDILRLTIEVWGAGGANPSYVAFAHDPAGRTTDWDTTGAVPSVLTLQLPVKIEL